MSINMAYTYPRELEKAKSERWPILIPVGTMEYHSAHCPFGCDTLVAMGKAEKIAEKIDCVVMPPIWYGVASYAVAGPEKNTIQVDCDTFELYVYTILKSLFKAGLNRNIFFIITHQTEDYNPMELACMKAARKLIFEYLEENVGYGWWGDNKNKDFYESLTGIDNPWNWVRCLSVLSQPQDIQKELNGDHAGKYECSELEFLYPGSVKLDRLAETDDWFAQDAIEMSVEIGRREVELSVEGYLRTIKGEK
ncbi:MAG: creatininase family protein [Clostridia bacterium]|nr:creatininase family protein [Clostridia bacterium]